MAIAPAARVVGQRLLAAFQEAGAQPVETAILQPAEVLLDLYGEDIRSRAYVTWDPLQGEMMLRPDFTVPVVQQHMAGGAEPARYCYLGEVFRRQDRPGARAREYLQAGYEVFAREDAAASDAEVFALFAGLLAPLRLVATIGDIGLLLAAVDGLETSAARKAALRRHIWRPRRFRALLDRFSGCTPPDPARQAMLGRLASGAVADQIAAAGPAIGRREPWEIAERAAALLVDAATPALSLAAADQVEALLQLTGPAPGALRALQDLAVEMPAIRAAVARLEARLAALERAGVDLGAVEFAASLGRGTMEYYDGFVFAFTGGAADWPPVASGGRYDALTRLLGQGAEIPAVGGIIRPGLVARLQEGAA